MPEVRYVVVDPFATENLRAMVPMPNTMGIIPTRTEIRGRRFAQNRRLSQLDLPLGHRRPGDPRHPFDDHGTQCESLPARIAPHPV